MSETDIAKFLDNIIFYERTSEKRLEERIRFMSHHDIQMAIDTMSLECHEMMMNLFSTLEGQIKVQDIYYSYPQEVREARWPNEVLSELKGMAQDLIKSWLKFKAGYNKLHGLLIQMKVWSLEEMDEREKITVLDVSCSMWDFAEKAVIHKGFICLVKGLVECALGVRAA